MAGLQLAFIVWCGCIDGRIVWHHYGAACVDALVEVSYGIILSLQVSK